MPVLTNRTATPPGKNRDGLALLRRAGLAWVGMFAMGFLNGALRELGFVRVFGHPAAQRLSVLSGILILTLFGALIWRKLGIRSRKESLIVGAGWLALTVLAETFVLNRWLGGLTWEQILATYDVPRGELWALVPLWMGLLPPVLWRWMPGSGGVGGQRDAGRAA